MSNLLATTNAENAKKEVKVNTSIATILIMCQGKEPNRKLGYCKSCSRRYYIKAMASYHKERKFQVQIIDELKLCQKLDIDLPVLQLQQHSIRIADFRYNSTK